MRLNELREQIETGMTAKLFAPKTHEHGIDLTIRVQKIGDLIVWQREKIETLNKPAMNKKYLNFPALLEGVTGMELRDPTWQITDEKIEIEPQTIENVESQ